MQTLNTEAASHTDVQVMIGGIRAWNCASFPKLEVLFPEFLSLCGSGLEFVTGAICTRSEREK